MEGASELETKGGRSATAADYVWSGALSVRRVRIIDGVSAGEVREVDAVEMICGFILN